MTFIPNAFRRLSALLLFTLAGAGMPASTDLLRSALTNTTDPLNRFRELRYSRLNVRVAP
jgi:hypothetical protein